MKNKFRMVAKWQDRSLPSLVKINLGLDLINHFNEKIQELKANDNIANNAHIYARKSFILTIQEALTIN